MDNAIKIFIGIGGGLASFLWGGWSALLQTLVLFIILDYVLAIIAQQQDRVQGDCKENINICIGSNCTPTRFNFRGWLIHYGCSHLFLYCQ